LIKKLIIPTLNLSTFSPLYADDLHLQITDWVNPASFLKKLFYDDVLPDERSHMVMVAMTHVLIIVDAYSAGGEISHSSKCRHYDCFFIRAHGN